MRSEFNRFFLYAFMAIFLSACGSASVSVDNPVDGNVYTEIPAIELSFTKGIPDPFEVSLNGQDITSQFALTETGGSASAASIESFIVSGDNLLKVLQPELDTVTFNYDNVGPAVHVTNVVDGVTLVVTGYATDASGVVSVSANGSAITLDADNKFTANIAAADYIDFVAEDTVGYISSSNYADDSVVMEDSMAVRINSNGLDFLISEITTLLEGEAIGDMIPSGSLYNLDVFVAEFDIYVDGASLGGADVDLVVTGAGGNFNLLGDFTNINADFRVKIDWPWPIPNSTISGSGTIDRARFDGDVGVSANNGVVSVNLANLDLDLDKIRTDISSFPDWLLTPFYELFEGLFGNLFGGLIEDLVPDLIAGFLDTFLADLEITLGDSTIKPLVLAQSVTSPNAGVDIVLDSHITAVTTTGPKNIGSAFGSDAAIPAPTTTTPGGLEKDIGVIVSENTLNQALTAVTEAGLLNLSIGAQELPEIGGIDPDAGNIRINITPTSAPSIDLVSDLAAGLGKLTWNDFALEIESYDDTTGEWTLYVGVIMNVGVTADLGITDDNAIAFEVVGLPSVEVLDIDLGSFILSANVVNDLIEEYFPVVLPGILNSIAAIPLPSFGGYGLNLGDLWIADVNANFVALAGDLVTDAARAEATASRTFASVGGVQATGMFGLGTAVSSGDVVTIDVSGSEDGMAYRYSVDGAPFGLWKNRTEVNLYGLRAGDHEVTVCSRNAMMVVDTDCDVVTFTTE
ncbi:MAG: hypothetical protein KUG73_10730 [Pseudomonadales bacterium]|nr:hypothetical protein [Pseudomonadales bacterium]